MLTVEVTVLELVAVDLSEVVVVAKASVLPLLALVVLVRGGRGEEPVLVAVGSDGGGGGRFGQPSTTVGGRPCSSGFPYSTWSPGSGKMTSVPSGTRQTGP
jgi:hypothetical protein